MSDRVGGRLYTHRFQGMFDEDYPVNLRAEMGALYYLPQLHPRLNRSIHAVNLKPAVLHPLSQDQPTLYFRDRHLTVSELTTDHQKTPYQLTYKEMRKTHEELKR